MGIAKVHRLEVVGHRDVKDQVLSALQSLGSVEVDDLSDVLDQQEDSPLSGMVQRESNLDMFLTAEEQLEVVRQGMAVLEKHAPVKKSLLEQFTGHQVPVDDWRYQEMASRIDEAADLSKRLVGLDQELDRAKEERQEVLNQLEQLLPFEGLRVSVEEIHRGRYVVVTVGVLESDAIEGVVDEVSALCDGALYSELIWSDRSKHGLLLAYPRTKEESVEAYLRSADFSRVSFGFASGTVSDRCKGLRESAEELGLESDGLLASILDLSEERVFVYAVHDGLASSKEMHRASERLVRTDRCFFLQGWIRPEDADTVRRRLSEVSSDTVVTVREPAEGERPPVVLENPKVFRPFEVVLQLYSMPVRSELDPTIFVAVFFSIFFAMALADAGYGLALAAICFLLLSRVRMSELGRKTFSLFLISGLAALILGLAMGGFFGVPLDFALVNPVESPIPFLLISFAIGLVQIYVGMAMEFYDNARKGRFLAGLLDQGLWFMLITSLVLLAVASQMDAGEVWVTWGSRLALGSAVGLVLTQGRHHRNPLMKLGSGAASLYNVSAYLSDILSYSRLLGLGMASGVVAGVINIVALMFWTLPYVGPLVAILVLVGGHTFNLFIAVIGAYVHCSRLQYIEFFSKFFEGGGRAFSPFRVEHRLVYLVEGNQQGGS